MKATSVLTAVLVTMLCGCAGIGTEVMVTKPAPEEVGESARTYVLASEPFDATPRSATRYRALVTSALASRGYDQADGTRARYRVALAYDTRLQSISVADGNACAAETRCADDRARPAFAWPWQKTYAHSLTLRFFDRETGREVYKVRAVRLDHRDDDGDALPYLVDSALAQLPFSRDGQWDVELRRADGGRAPAVISTTPRAR